MRKQVRARALLGCALVAGLLGGCSLPTAAPAPLVGDARVRVVAAFYPLEFLAQRVGGPHVEVVGLTKPGAEPHDTELTARSLGSLSYAHLVVYLSGFQPAVDAGVADRVGGTAYDVRGDAGLPPLEAGETTEAHEHSAEHEGEASEASDAHFWLDPVAYAAVGTALGERLAAVDPRHAADYRGRAAALAGELRALDTAFHDGLARCASRTVVVGHAAFGFLARRYDLVEIPIAGLSPDQEPSARELADIAATVREAGVRTVYAETLTDPAFARTVADATGATLATLDPIEGITALSAGADYLEVMRADLAALRLGQECQ